jgi:hypothetical protein
MGTLLCLSAMMPVKAAPANIFDGKPVFTQDLIDQEGDRRIVFNTRTDDDIDGFDFKVNEDVKALRMTLKIDGEPRPRSVEAGSKNTVVTTDPMVIDLR